jgi:hypothetical protein
MRRLTAIDKRRDDRHAQRLAELRSKVDQSANDDERRMWLRHVEREESISKWDRIFPLGVWIYMALLVAWFVPWAVLSRDVGATAGVAYLIAYPLIVGAIWVTRRILRERVGRH